MFKNDNLAISVWKNKYALPDETHHDQMHMRMARQFAKIEKRYSKQITELKSTDFNYLSKYGKSRTPLTTQGIFELFKDFKYIVPQGSVMSQLGSKTLGSLSNCFVIGQPADSYSGIFEKDQQMAQLMKRRGGVGIDLSTLRPEGATTNNVARTSTGAASFMHRFSNTTREVAQNGRRGALMMSMDVRHPDIMSFVKVKRNLTQVTGANISVKLTDDFMNDVKNEETHSLQFPVDSDSNVGTIPAKELWDEIIKSAHGVAEPGLLFWDNMVNYSPDGVYPQFKPITTNPCSEIAMQPYDACRLIAVNLLSFVKKPFTKDAYFDHGHFHTVNYEAMVLSDDLIDLELEHIKRILDKIKKDPENVKLKHTEFDLWTNIYNTARSSRRTGLGFTGLGDTLAALGFRYDDPDALTRVEEIMHTKLLSELECTTDLSIHRGHFEGWKASTERKGNAFYEFIEKKFPKQWAKMQRVGRRNVSWSTVAPTGTVSIMTQTTSGIEPLFAGFYTRRKKINPNEKGARVDFVDDNGDSWTEYQILHPQFKEWIRQHKGDYLFDGSEDAATKEELQEWFDQSPWYGSTAADINWDMRLQMQATIQKYVTHSISSTINLPRDTSEEVVSEIYKNAWSLGIKGITVYRDGSRDGVLLTDSKPKEEDFNYKDAMKRPKTLQCEVHTTMYRGKEFAVIVGLYQNKPYEVFAFENIFDLKSVTGVIKKATRGVYELSVEDKVIMPNITFEMEDEEEALTRMLSTALRHGTDITFVVEQLRKSKGDITAFSKSIARVLTKYTKPREEEEMCPECSSQMIREEGCLNCKACGHSKCG